MHAFFHLLFGWFGVATLIGCAAVAVAIFSVWIDSVMPVVLLPFTTNLRHYAIAVAIIAFSFTAVSGRYYNEGIKIEKAKWDAAVQAAIDKGQKAHDDAEHSVDTDPDGRLPDNFNRDQP